MVQGELHIAKRVTMLCMSMLLRECGRGEFIKMFGADRLAQVSRLMQDTPNDSDEMLSDIIAAFDCFIASGEAPQTKPKGH